MKIIDTKFLDGVTTQAKESPRLSFFECKEGPFVPHEVDGFLEV